jgi:hypothetical protein
MASILAWLRTFGFDPKRTIQGIKNLPVYHRERRKFQQQLGGEFEWGTEFPILDERDCASGSLGAYFHQDQLVARWIHQNRPIRHIDIGSRIDGFIGHLAIFREVEVLDIRPQNQIVQNMVFHQLDLMDELPEEWIECTDSLSCLHTIEHFGLGRYGDPIDATGHLKGLIQMKRMVKRGGLFYLSTPIGTQRVEFNAHRIFAVDTVLSWFAEGWNIEQFAIIDDQDQVNESVDWRAHTAGENYGCQSGVSIVVARKM